MTRRDLLRAAVAVPLVRAAEYADYAGRGLGRPTWRTRARATAADAMADLANIRNARCIVVPADLPAGARSAKVGGDVSRIELTRNWTDDICTSRLTNRGTTPVSIKEVVLFDLALTFPASSAIYGEGFQMLSQTGGTLGEPKDLGSYTDAKHYRMPVAEGTRHFYGLLTIRADREWILAFTSCRRFSGFFRLRSPSALQVAVDTEGLTIEPGESWDLEELCTASGQDSAAPIAVAAKRLIANHPPLETSSPPTGWCSWYCFGPRVTAQQVLDNLDVIAKRIPDLKYVQIDDGYQPAMGDWLETGTAFGGDVRGVLDAIRTRGFQPAIWVAPFIAEEASLVFQQHRDWFVKDPAGAPLRSDTVTFGGWRRGPWYVLDGTHPDVQAHLERVFGTMRREWGCTYFKLDANFWGAIHGGRFHDPKATRVEAYRRGMHAVRRGAGDGFLLGCNHPLWPSLGLVHGSRSSNDIKRAWDRVKSTAEQNLRRNWQNGRLWWNDPDAVVLTGDLTDDEFVFHATAIYASGGMVLSGDDLTSIPEPRLAMLKRLVPPTGVPAVFEGADLSVGTIALPRRRVVCLFNWGDGRASLGAALPRVMRITDFWTGREIGRRGRRIESIDMPAHSARLLVCEDA